MLSIVRDPMQFIGLIESLNVKNYCFYVLGNIMQRQTNADIFLVIQEA